MAENSSPNAKQFDDMTLSEALEIVQLQQQAITSVAVFFQEKLEAKDVEIQRLSENRNIATAQKAYRQSVRAEVFKEVQRYFLNRAQAAKLTAERASFDSAYQRHFYAQSDNFLKAANSVLRLSCEDGKEVQ